MPESVFDRYRDIIPQYGDFVAALHRPLPTCIWGNPRKTTADELEAHFRRQHIDFEPIDWRPMTYRIDTTDHPGTRFGFLAGLYQIQEEVSMLPVECLDLQAGQRVLDTCAAPGSKTSLMAATVGPRATIIANDRNFRRMAPLGRSLDRLGIANTSMMTHDATNLPVDVGTFDRVLADVPCSCEGTSRKTAHPTAATDADFQQLCTIQRAILKRSLELTRPGGRVVYSTCTYAPEENEAIVDSILDEFGDRWSVVSADIDGVDASAGCVNWRGAQYDDQLQNAMRVYPHQNDTGGFFVAVLQHNADSHG